MKQSKNMPRGSTALRQASSTSTFLSSKTHSTFFIIFIIFIFISISYFFTDKINNFQNTRFVIKKENVFYKLYIEKTPEKLNLPNFDVSPFKKNIFRIWCSKNPIGECGGRRGSNYPLDITSKNLPEWNQVIYDDESSLKFIHKYFGETHKICVAYNLLNYGVAKADLMRYLLIYIFGGLYLDMKSCVTSPIEKIPDDKDLVVSNWGSHWYSKQPHTHLFVNGEFQNWYIYGRQGAPILAEIIEKVVQNIFDLYNNPNLPNKIYDPEEPPSKGIVLATTGPIAYTSVIENSLNKKTVFVSKTINSSIKYMCQRDEISNNHYSNKKIPLVNHISNFVYIPKNIYFTNDKHTYKNIDNYNVFVYTDSDLTDKLNKYFDENIFQFLQKEFQKKELWLYINLFLYGGTYDEYNRLDSLSIDRNIKKCHLISNLSNTFLTTKDILISTPPFNNIMWDMITYIINNLYTESIDLYSNKLKTYIVI